MTESARQARDNLVTDTLVTEDVDGFEDPSKVQQELPAMKTPPI